MFWTKLLMVYYLMDSTPFTTSTSPPNRALQFHHNEQISTSLPYSMMASARYKRNAEDPSKDISKELEKEYTRYPANDPNHFPYVAGLNAAKASAKGIIKDFRKDLANVNELYDKLKRKCESYELLLGVRTEFEHALMDTLYPKDFPTTNSQYFKCLFVTHMQIGPMADTYRRIIRESEFSLDEFCLLADTEIYDPKSKIVHKVQIPSHCLTIENYKAIIQDDEKLMAFIKDGHRREDIISTILKLRQARLTHTGPLGISAFPENSNRCILIKNVPLKKEYRPRYIPKSQIQSVFKVKQAKNNILSICETKESYVEGMTAGKVLVEFAKPVHTAWALLEHQKTVLEHDISIKLVNCDDWNCADENKWSSGTNSQ